MKRIVLCASLLCGATLAQELPPPVVGIADLRRSFEKPPADSRIMMRWWWFGPAITKPELLHEMQLMKEGGIGGFEVQPVYALALDDPGTGIRTLPFLSDEFLDALSFVSDKARELGLRMDLTLGSGWPFGGSQVSIAQASARLRIERVKVAAGARRVPPPDMGAGESLIAAFIGGNEVATSRDGTLELPPGPSTPAEVVFFVSSRTGMMVKRPAIGSEGFVLNHYDAGALDAYLKNTGDRLLKPFGARPPYAVFCDSLEVYGGDWTPDFLAEFQKRRGYDLRPHLPALVGDATPETAGIRDDWGRTLTELLDDRFLAPLKAWSERNRTKLRGQIYGIPPATLSSNALVDLPEGEGYQWKSLRATRWASSASHIYGRPVTSSETWTWLHSPVFRATPLDVKAEADLHFLQGINQLIGHGWPYTAEGVAHPGWRFYAAGVFNEKNPWWIAMPDLALYLQRVSFLMRQGRPANDVAIYLPTDDAWATFAPGQVHLIQVLEQRVGTELLPRLIEAGYGADFFDDQALAKVGRVTSGALQLGGNPYRVVILPGVERMPLATYQKLQAFVREGGVLIATRRAPGLAPGFRATASDHEQIRAISTQLFDPPSKSARLVETEDDALTTALTSLASPDVALAPRNGEFGFVHRKTDDADIYFLANTSNAGMSGKATFRATAARAEWWEPMTGGVTPVHVEATRSGKAVNVDLPAYGSRVLLFWNGAADAPARAPLMATPADLGGGWRVSFDGGPKDVAMPALKSWTDDETTRFFSGLATYEKSFDLPASFTNAAELRLDFGEAKPIEPLPRARMQAWLEAPVREAAVVYVNGKRAGSLWCPPYSIDVKALLKPGQNSLRVVVGNLAVNSMAGRPLPDYRLLNLRYGVRFEAQDMDKIKPEPSGLLGPVRLIALSTRPL